jgi:uncharacterized protein (DUF2249 family)
MLAITKNQTSASSNILDLRHINPSERCLRIVTAFEALAPGNSFVLISNADPESHHCHLASELGPRCEWRILEQSHNLWRILISKPL